MRKGRITLNSETFGEFGKVEIEFDFDIPMKSMDMLVDDLKGTIEHWIDYTTKSKIR